MIKININFLLLAEEQEVKLEDIKLKFVAALLKKIAPP